MCLRIMICKKLVLINILDLCNVINIYLCSLGIGWIDYLGKVVLFLFVRKKEVELNYNVKIKVGGFLLIK